MCRPMQISFLWVARPAALTVHTIPRLSRKLKVKPGLSSFSGGKEDQAGTHASRSRLNCV